MQRHDPLIIEGRVLRHQTNTDTRNPGLQRGQPVRRPRAPPWPLQRSLVVLVVGLILIAAISLTAPIVAALPGLGGLFDRAAKSTMERIGSHSALVNPAANAVQVAPIFVERSDTR